MKSGKTYIIRRIDEEMRNEGMISIRASLYEQPAAKSNRAGFTGVIIHGQAYNWTNQSRKRAELK
jgi:hypothetical protein